MEKYFVYLMTCTPLSLPSFVLVYKAIKKKLLNSVFNQQISLMFLLNGKYFLLLKFLVERKIGKRICCAGLYVVLTTSLSLYILSEPPERSLPCQMLLNLRTSYLVSIMASGTVAVMFRYLMIQYSERGLVSRGLNIDLYNKLFWTCTFFSLLLYHSMIMAMNLREENFVSKTISGSLCSDPSKPFSLSKYWTNHSKNLVLRNVIDRKNELTNTSDCKMTWACFSILFKSLMIFHRVCFVSFSLGYSAILVVSAVTSHKIRKCNSYHVKTQIGKFRRNILTLSETMTPMLLLTLTELSRVMILQYSLTYQETEHQRKRITNILIIILNIVTNDLVLGVFLPCKVISNLVRDMPDRSPRTEASFYTRAPRFLVGRRVAETRPGGMVTSRLQASLPPVEI